MGPWLASGRTLYIAIAQEPHGLLSRVGLFVSALSLTLLACAREPLRPDPRYAHLGMKVIVDDSPAWSPDGRFIAYHRAFRSSDGPPGVYLIRRDGGPSRFITQGDFFGPRHLRFSPDGRHLVASWSLRLLIIDVESGAVTWPLPAGAVGTFPDWSRDGQIVYVGAPSLDHPSDSSGIRLYDPSTGVDRRTDYQGGILHGSRVRWSRDGSEFVYIGSDPTTSLPMIFLARIDGSTLRVLVPPGMLPEYVQWYSRPSIGLDGVLFLDTGKLPQPTYFVSRLGGRPVRWRMYLGPYGTVSPDGSEVVEDFPQQPDSLKVLFLISMDDVTGATRRQLTRWQPPTPQSASAANRGPDLTEKCFLKGGEHVNAFGSFVSRSIHHRGLSCIRDGARLVERNQQSELHRNASMHLVREDSR